ncbi:DUF2256 domain-containing protein [Gammaproteobacteria bacterium]|nr:DUF2256 domain-containing protein [Gammaproteobacteria bacterium]MDC1339975.1 DUF2256 domain-containing protein [bacterium]MDA9258687.1 DUF2256 domain-containing protein [Gammaproteobacteria bacterium]MDB0069859.1 DUF2256 domain-containing protein [Gammaproteobacteria bacterium]MDC0129496.1 DUF2256 domain-containing protein [Gammaproteobacteria bacterium]
MLHKKLNLKEKICRHCNKPFAWRKKWERSWDEVQFCSSRCKSESKKTPAHLEV